MKVRFWDNSKEYHGTLLWEGSNSHDFPNWEQWVKAQPPRKGQPVDPFWDVTLEYFQVKS